MVLWVTPGPPSLLLTEGLIISSRLRGAAQIVANPRNHGKVIILYAGLSGDATRVVCDNSAWQKDLAGYFLINASASYVIYNDHKRLASGYWEDCGTTFIWLFK